MAKYRSREMATNVKLLTPTDTPTNRSHENTDRLYMRNNPPQCLLKIREPKAKSQKSEFWIKVRIFFNRWANCYKTWLCTYASKSRCSVYNVSESLSETIYVHVYVIWIFNSS